MGGAGIQIAVMSLRAFLCAISYAPGDVGVICMDQFKGISHIFVLGFCNPGTKQVGAGLRPAPVYTGTEIYCRISRIVCRKILDVSICAGSSLCRQTTTIPWTNQLTSFCWQQMRVH
ncbi:uncharacterized protein BJX67DRAFT_62790 [Aspergillus lucknowensis]|uniref:Secreted protein n=1 Tax=Aspergillus lucknowensis TaxID=176173 RepID=A0ABR4LUF7_9EURO